MELELKYVPVDKSEADAIWEDERLRRYADSSSIETLLMKAVYFDTPSGKLGENSFAVRVRSEGERIFTTLKGPGTVEGGLHEREEINLPCEASCFIESPRELFKSFEKGREILELIGDEPLVNLLEMRFLRRRFRINYGSSIMELSIDTGKMIGDGGEIPILELEVELFAGDSKDLLKFGEKLSAKYNLKPENRTKLARGFAVLKKEIPLIE
ncbi:MAG: CYTH domain-containing protein [Clostridiales bacterium]|nr:CYTH domain-containing protein [Clostridiales bacterium]